jgi:hypothetical protein
MPKCTGTLQCFGSQRLDKGSDLFIAVTSFGKGNIVPWILVKIRRVIGKIVARPFSAQSTI